MKKLSYKTTNFPKQIDSSKFLAYYHWQMNYLKLKKNLLLNFPILKKKKNRYLLRQIKSSVRRRHVTKVVNFAI